MTTKKKERKKGQIMVTGFLALANKKLYYVMGASDVLTEIIVCM